MASAPTTYERIGQVLARFSERERVLLVAMVCVLGALLVTSLGYLGSQKLGSLSDDNEAKRAAIASIIREREAITAKMMQRERLNDQLENNDLRMNSFVEQRASALGIRRPTEFTERQEQATAGVTEFLTTVEFPQLSPRELDDFLREVYFSEELVHIRTIETEQSRRSPSDLTANITLATYRRERTSGSEED